MNTFAPPPFDYTIDDIMEACGAPYADRGRRYAREGRVTRAAWEEPVQRLIGTVTGNHPYSQIINMTQTQRGIRIQGACSCPVGRNCKHVAAVLFHLLEISDMTAQGNGRWRRWRAALKQDLKRQQTLPDADSNHRQHLYLLSTEAGASSNAISLSVYKTRPLKRGGWSKPVAAKFEDAFDYLAEQQLCAIDVDIARLAVDPRRWYGNTSQLDLRDEHGGLLLSLLLKSGRCYYQTFSGPPLAPGPERAGELNWQADDAGQLTLSLSLSALTANWLLLPTTPACYLDRQRHQVGQILISYSGSTLGKLLAMPAIAPDRVKDLVNLVAEDLPELPLPPQLEHRSLNTEPQPVLQLLGAPIGKQLLPVARLQVRYGPLLLDCDFQAKTLVSRDGQLWSVTRRPKAEWHFLETLSELGLSLARQIGFNGAAAGDLTMEGHHPTERARQWQQLLAQTEQLAQQGWEIQQQESFPLQFASASQLHGSITEAGQHWFELGLEVEIAGERTPLLPLLYAYLEQDTDQDLFVETAPHHWLEVPRAVIAPVANTLVELHQPRPVTASSLTLPTALAATLAGLEESLAQENQTIHWHGADRLRALADKLRHFDGLQAVPLPDGLNATLRPYQHQGVNWLQFLRDYGFGGILADDMGLGKTLQALTHLLIEKQHGRMNRPALILAPTSVLGNWQREAARFTPALRVWVSHGPGRRSHVAKWPDYDLVITSYPLLVRDSELLDRQRFSTVILDEAQQIKNPKTKMARAACALNADHRLCLTGTPIENNLNELWSQFHFLMPGFLGSPPQFNTLYRHPIERENDSDRYQALRTRLAPFILRRTKQQVAKELPPKTEIVQTIELGNEQAKLYESVRATTEKQVQHWLSLKGLDQSRIQVLDALLKLRQICCDPQLLKLEQAQKIKQSAKRQQLNDMLQELVAEGRKILVFSQFTSMLALIEADLTTAGIRYSKLTGRTRKRDEAIQAFQNGPADVFLISLKAGGVGLNLTAADTVIHYDPWWNPAAEQQATDRAYRIGQDKPVFVYKLITENTVEEKIRQLQQRKAALADALLEQGDAPLNHLNGDELLALLTATA